MKTFQRLIWTSYNKNSKIKRVKSWKLINGSKLLQKIRKKKQRVYIRTKCHMYLVFKSFLRSQWHLTHFSICKKIVHPKARFNTNKLASQQIFPMNFSQLEKDTCMLVALRLHCFDLALGCIYAKSFNSLIQS